MSAAGWKLDEAAGSENAPGWVTAHTSLVARTVKYTAQHGHDLFTNMEVAATQGELTALYAAHAKGGAPALMIPYDNQHVVRTFAFVSTKYLGYEAAQPVWSLPGSIELEA